MQQPLLIFTKGDNISGGHYVCVCVCVCVCVLVYASLRGPNVPTRIVKPGIFDIDMREKIK